MVSGAPETVTVSVRAGLDLFASVRLRAILTDLIVGQGNLTVAVDLRGVSSLDPAAIGVFAAAATAVEAQGGTLTLRGTPSGFVAAFGSAGLARLIRSDPGQNATLLLGAAATNSRSRHPAGSAHLRPDLGILA